MSVKKAIQDILLWRGLNFLSVFILNVLVARLFEASQAGSLFFFINNLSLIILVLSFSLESGMGYYAAAGNVGASRLAVLALIWCVLSSLLTFLLFDSIAFYLSPLNDINSKLTAIFFIAGSLLISFYSALYFARENFFIPNVCLLIINLVLIILFVLGMQGMVAAKWLLYAYFAGYMIQGILIAVFYFFIKEGRNYALPSSTDLQKIIKYSSVAFLSNIIFFLVYRVDYWFVEKYCTPGELGNYIQVSKIVQWLLLIPMMVGTAIFPLTASGKDTGLINKIVSISRVLLWIYLFVCLGLAITGFWIFVWIFGKTYTYMYPVFLLHIPGILALVSMYPVSSYHAGIKRVDINLKGSLLALLVIIMLNALFTPVYGIYAAAVASSAGYIVYFIFSLYFFSRENKIKIYHFFKPVITDYTSLKSILDKPQ
ncbi:MAG: polysaccharide biosynthesis C-terminal domain-containing protein [Chitinophagaceae bacterium]